MEAAVTPFPKPERTPPETKMYLVGMAYNTRRRAFPSTRNACASPLRTMIEILPERTEDFIEAKGKPLNRRIESFPDCNDCRHRIFIPFLGNRRIGKRNHQKSAVR